MFKISKIVTLRQFEDDIGKEHYHYIKKPPYGKMNVRIDCFTFEQNCKRKEHYM